jgi:hypothetical protein
VGTLGNTSRRGQLAETSQTPGAHAGIVEHAFANIASMQAEDVDRMRRSLAIGGSLTRADTERLLDACADLLAQRDAVTRILGELGPSFRETRATLNELARVVGGR